VQKKPIKLLIVENDLIIGGVQRLTLDQLRGLDKSVFSPSLFTLMQFRGKGDFYNLVPEGVSVTKFDFKGFLDLKGWVAIIQELRKLKPDIIKTSLFFSNNIFRILKPFFGYKLISAEHNTGTPRKWSFRILDRFLSTFSNAIIADSKEVSSFITSNEKIDPRKMKVIYNGVDIEGIQNSKKELFNQREQIRKEIGINPTDKVFLSVARITTQKNHELMVNAFNLLLKERNDSVLVILGDGSLRKKVEDQVESLGLTNKVLVLGENKYVHKYYAISDYFLLTSRHEGFCIAAMEALAFGLPVISTRVAGVIEYLKDGYNGFFSDATPESFRSAMKKALSLSSSELPVMKENAVSTADKYSVKRYSDEFGKLLLVVWNNQKIS